MKLGKTQESCLRALIRHGSWPGGWLWVNDSSTVRILDSLVKRGLAEHRDDGSTRYGRYTVTAAGRSLVGQ